MKRYKFVQYMSSNEVLLCISHGCFFKKNFMLEENRNGPVQIPAVKSAERQR